MDQDQAVAYLNRTPNAFEELVRTQGTRGATCPSAAFPVVGYSREKFPHCSEAQEYGWEVQDPSCDVRDAALIRDGKDVQVGEGCDIVSGEWLDPYTGNTYTNPFGDRHRLRSASGEHP